MDDFDGLVLATRVVVWGMVPVLVVAVVRFVRWLRRR